LDVARGHRFPFQVAVYLLRLVYLFYAFVKIAPHPPHSASSPVTGNCMFLSSQSAVVQVTDQRSGAVSVVIVSPYVVVLPR
jgi:hypothetical protein